MSSSVQKTRPSSVSRRRQRLTARLLSQGFPSMVSCS